MVVRTGSSGRSMEIVNGLIMMEDTIFFFLMVVHGVVEWLISVGEMSVAE